MPHWPTSDTPAADRAREQFTLDHGDVAEHVAVAPSTYPVIGEHVDHYGGTVIMGVGSAQVAVAVRRTDGDAVTVKIHRADGSQVSDSISSGEIARRAAEQFPGIDEAGRPTTPPVPEGGPAAQLGGIVHTMVGRQLLPRDTAGVDVTVISEIPPGPALGEAEAIDAAFALALQADAEDLSDAPLRARLAELCAQSAEQFSARPLSRARFTTALRSAPDSLSVIDYADGSLTQAPHPAASPVRVFALLTPAGDGDDGERGRREFLDDACRAFGTESLRLLPDARVRVLDWLRAVHKVHPDVSAPETGEADTWLSYFDNETTRAQQVAVALRSRRVGDVWAFLADSQRETARVTGLDGSLAQLALSRGAHSARSAGPGSALCFVPAPTADNFAADLAADGLTVLELPRGEAAQLS